MSQRQMRVREKRKGEYTQVIERLESVYLLNLRQIRLLALFSVWEHGRFRIDAILLYQVAFVQN